MTQVLKRVTTEFIPAEDRVRMAGVGDDEQPVVIWLTRRLIGLLLPVLLQRLDSQFNSVMPEHRQTLQEFAQQAARDAFEASAPVVVKEECETMLATSADVAHAEHAVVLTFRDEAGGAFSLPLSSDALRQWLQILYRADHMADWQLPQWPAWLSGESSSVPESIVAMH
jgi:hypothetical protein